MSLPLRYSVTSGNAAQMLYSCAECLPAKVALVESNSGISFSYAELRAGSAGLAGLLRQSAIGAGDRVGILLERGGASAAACILPCWQAVLPPC